MPVRRINNWWYVDFRCEGIRYRKKSPANTRAGAQNYEAVLRQRLAQGHSVDRPQLESPWTFKKFSKEWYDTYVEANNKPTEKRTKKWVLRIHLVPFFGHKKLSEITTSDVERFKIKKNKEGLSPKSINNFLSVFNRCMASAEEDGLIETLPRCKRLRVAQKAVHFLSEEEVRKLLSYQAEPFWHTMITIARFTGMRISEILALQWEDINFKNNLITVRQAFSLNKLESTKSYRVRYIPMSNTLRSVLEQRRKESGFLFLDEKRRPIKYDAAVAALRRACRMSGIRKIGWHLLRHTFASHLVGKNASIRAVQELLGHSTIAMTERYSHLSHFHLINTISLLDKKSNI